MRGYIASARYFKLARGMLKKSVHSIELRCHPLFSNFVKQLRSEPDKTICTGSRLVDERDEA